MIDFEIQNHGTVWVFTPKSQLAKELTDKVLPLEPWQYIGTSFAVDHRPAALLCEQLRAEGYTLNRGD